MNVSRGEHVPERVPAPEESVPHPARLQGARHEIPRVSEGRHDDPGGQGQGRLHR